MNKFLKLIKPSLLIILIYASVFLSAHASIGSYSNFVDRMGAGVREMSLGNAASADFASANPAYWNPALPALQRSTTISLGQEERSLGRYGSQLSFASAIGARMGFGFTALLRGDHGFEVIDWDDENKGESEPWWMNSYLSLAWRTSPYTAYGASFQISYENYDLANILAEENIVFNDIQSSPFLLHLGWMHRWNEKFDLAFTIRNLGWNSDLTASREYAWTSDNTIPTATAYAPREYHAGIHYHAYIKEDSLTLALEVIDYQLSPVLWEWDGDLHVQSVRLGVDWQPLDDLHLRSGYDDGSWSLGFGYAWKMGQAQWPVQIDYALLVERNVYLWQPWNLGIKFSWP
jgi:hypothetical protein